MGVALITGTTGFVGSRLATAIQRSHEVVPLNRRPVPGCSRQVVWDFRGELPAGLPRALDTIIHCASPLGAGSLEHELACFNVNVCGTTKLIAYARQVGSRAFLFVSTGSVYGLSPEASSEETPLAPSGAYACSKAAGEYVVRAHQDYMRTLCVRLFHPYGPRQRLPRVVPQIVDRILSGRTVILNGAAGEPVMSPVFVDDATEWILRLIAGPASGVFNLAGSEVVSIRNLAEQIGSLLGREVLYEERPPIGGGYIGDSTRVIQATGYLPKWNVDRGLREMLRHPFDSTKT